MNNSTATFNLWTADKDNWPRLGEYFRVARYCGTCIACTLNTDKQEALFTMRVQNLQDNDAIAYNNFTRAIYTQMEALSELAFDD